MKIRTITAGCNLSNISIEENKKLINKVASDLDMIKQFFEKKGYVVQTKRLSTQPLDDSIKSKEEFNQICSLLQSLCPNHIDYFNIGPTRLSENLSDIISFFSSYPHGFCTVNLLKNNQIQIDQVKKAAALIKKISTIEKQGFANLRFAALCNVNANTPFYPASFHQGSSSFGIGCENSDVVKQAFSKSDSFNEGKTALYESFLKHYQKLEQEASEIAKQTSLEFNGIDTSISPSVDPKESLIYAIEELPFVSYFGGPGSLAASGLITQVLKELPLKKCGYNGLMLPVMEDSGLAERNSEKRISVSKLLCYSSVCGTGLDTIPLPGDISIEALEGILLDVATLSKKLNKALSARLMPIPNKKAGDVTEFTFEYFKNTIVMNP